jgi:hypothetical protein
MGTVTLRPNAELTNMDQGGSSAWTPAGTTWDQTDDDSDATYAQFDNGGWLGDYAATLEVAMTTVALPAGAQIRSVTPRVRDYASHLNYQPILTASLKDNTGAAGWLNHGGSTSVVTRTGSARTTKANGAAWDQAGLDDLRMAYSVSEQYKTANHGNALYRIYELNADVLYNERPVAVVTGPTEGATIISTQPTVTWTYADPEADAQERYRIRVFSAAEYGIGGFDPETSPATWDSGDVFSSALSAVVGTVLAQGTTYRAYVKVSDAGSSGRFSLWDSNTFTIQSAVSGSAASPGTGPAAPSLTAVLDAALARVVLTLQGRDNMLTYHQSSAEGPDTEGWLVNLNCTLARSTAQAAEGVGSFAMTSVAAGNMGMVTPLGATSLHAVTAGGTYTALASLRAATVARSCNVTVTWYTAAGASAGSASVSGVVADTTGGWTQLAVTAAAPVGAAFAAVAVNVLSTGGAGEVHYVDKISLAPGSSTVWTPGGFVAGPNMLTADQATAEVAITGWTGTNAALARTTLQDFDGLASIMLTASSAATMSMTTPTGVAGKPVTAGQVYSATAQVLASVTVRSCTLAITWYTAAGAVVSTTTGTARTDSTSGWTRLFVAGIAPATAAYAALVLTVTSPANAEVHYADRLQLASGVTDLWLDPAVPRRRVPELVASDDAGVTWFDLPRLGLSDDLPDSQLHQPVGTFYDYEVPGNVTRRYRARTLVAV